MSIEKTSKGFVATYEDDDVKLVSIDFETEKMAEKWLESVRRKDAKEDSQVREETPKGR